MKTRVLLLLGLVLAGCHEMYDQPRYQTFAVSDFYEDHLSARPVVPGTIARGRLADDELLTTGKIDGKDADVFPFPITRAVLDRGRQRYDVFCSPCHDRTGSGRGMVVRRGFRTPPTFHQERLRTSPAGHYFDVITNGFGAMYGYAPRIPVEDRWAITAYVRALQLSQNATLEHAPEAERAKLTEVTP